MGNQQIRKTKRTYQGIFSFFTIFFIILLVVIVIYFLLIFAEPQSILNPFPPATPKNSISQNEVALALTQTIAIENQFSPKLKEKGHFLFHIKVINKIFL